MRFSFASLGNSVIIRKTNFGGFDAERVDRVLNKFSGFIQNTKEEHYNIYVKRVDTSARFLRLVEICKKPTKNFLKDYALLPLSFTWKKL